MIIKKNVISQEHFSWSVSMKKNVCSCHTSRALDDQTGTADLSFSVAASSFLSQMKILC
jgi:hypothetical protein